MKNNNILIATQSLGIGGCETYILTECKILKKLGYNIVIIAKDGILRNDFESIGVKFYEVDFSIMKKEIIEKIESIIEIEKISQVHIHPFFPFYTVVVSSILKKIPYILYFHGVINIDSIFEDILGRGISKLYLNNVVFKYASKFVYVSEEVKKFYEDKYNLDYKKGCLLKNSVYLDEVSFNETISDKITKFIILSRLDDDKFNSIIQAIDFYIKYYLEYSKKYNEVKDLSLHICGDGNAITKIKEYLNSNGNIYNIKFIGASNTEVYDLINKYDVVMGMGRCILEAISVKKIPILVSYDEYIGIIDSSNSILINKIAYSNFSGRGVNPGNIDDDIKRILDLNLVQKNDIINSNYNYIKENNNIGNFGPEIKSIIELYERFNYDVDIKSYVEIITNNISQKNDIYKGIELYEYLKNEYEVINKKNENLECQLFNIKEEYENVKKQYKFTKNQLENIKGKKLYKMYKYAKDIFKNEGGQK